MVTVLASLGTSIWIGLLIVWIVQGLIGAYYYGRRIGRGGEAAWLAILGPILCLGWIPLAIWDYSHRKELEASQREEELAAGAAERLSRDLSMVDKLNAIELVDLSTRLLEVKLPGDALSVADRALALEPANRLAGEAKVAALTSLGRASEARQVELDLRVRG